MDSYLEFVAKIKGVDSTIRSKRIAEVKDRVSIQEYSGTVIKHLSKGYRQRVGLAQALVHDPEVLILDEPTVGLDPNQITDVRNLIKSLAGNHTVILSTHILPEVGITCQRVVIINKGRIAAVDTPENLNPTVARIGSHSADRERTRGCHQGKDSGNSRESCESNPSSQMGTGIVSFRLIRNSNETCAVKLPGKS